VAEMRAVAWEVRDGWTTMPLELITDKPKKKKKAMKVEVGRSYPDPRGRAGNPYKGLHLALVHENLDMPAASDFK
jgi:hypothetical protein